MHWKDELFTVHREHLKDKEVKRLNRLKKFDYGHNKFLDAVVISKDGTVGDIYLVQGLRIAMPKAPEDMPGCELPTKEQIFKHTPKPESLKRIRTMVDFRALHDPKVKTRWAEYIEQEWTRRLDGYWYMNNGEATYITGGMYFFLNYHTIDTETGRPDFRHSNRIFYYFLEATYADDRCYGMCYLKNRRSGFSHMAASDAVHTATMSRNSHLGILSKTATDAKQLFVEKVVGSNNGLPFYFKPIQSGMDKPKTELVFSVPSVKLSKKGIQQKSQDEEYMDGLDTKITWLATASNSYDGFKLKRLYHDESGKWEKPNSIKRNWTVTKTCLRLGKRIVGKVMMGSTSNSLAKGGQEFKTLYYQSDLREVKRNLVGQTPSGMYAFFINALWNMEGFFDIYGWPVIADPSEPIPGVDGGIVDIGSRAFWEAEYNGLSGNSDDQNEFTRQFPLSEKHAFRDEALNSLFNLTRIYDQIDYNESIIRNGYVTVGSFKWSGNPFESEVEFYPHKDGRFHVSWLPDKQYRNHINIKHGGKYAGNEISGAFGCDSYDISGTVGGGGSNGALHGITNYSIDPKVPSHQFFLEYVARPQTSEIFFNDVLMACVFYGMPILIENNKPGLLMYFKRNGFRGFCINRPDKHTNKLSVSERELGGIPNSGEAVKQMHASAIESYIEDHVGYREDGTAGDMFFTRTLEDWARFDISDRTKFDASISSGLALMAIHKHKYKPTAPRQEIKIKIPIGQYTQKGGRSELK